MDASLFLAQAWGIYLVVVGVAVLANQKRLKKMSTKLLKDDGLMFFGGALSLMLGIVLVLFHTVWEMSWAGLITLLGWLTLFKGLMWLVFPDAARHMAKNMMHANWYMVSGLLSLVLGLYLGYVGFLF